MPGRTPFGPGTMWRLRAWPRLICRKSSGVALGTVVAIAYLAGALDFLERSFQDARFRLASTPASGEVVVVAIDSESLAWLEVWPWPRRLYADVVERLIAAGARRIALDLDFSSASDPEDDARLATALAAAARAGSRCRSSASCTGNPTARARRSIPRPCRASRTARHWSMSTFSPMPMVPCAASVPATSGRVAACPLSRCGSTRNGRHPNGSTSTSASTRSASRS